VRPAEKRLDVATRRRSASVTSEKGLVRLRA
jgi:hypothetical protein